MKEVILFLAMVCALSCSDEAPTISQSLNRPTVVEDSLLPSIFVNGTYLHAEAFGNPNDPLLVFLHGGPGGDYRNALSVRQLADDGFYVVFYDQRGSGLSQRHDHGSYSIQLVLDDLSAVIGHYRSTADQKVFLFGHSWGAMLAAAYINEYPMRVDGVIFAEPGGFTKELLDLYAENSRPLSLFSEETNDILYYDQFLTGGENDHEILDYKLSLSTSFAYQSGNAEGIEGPSPIWRYGAVVLNNFVDIAENDGFDFTTTLHEYPKRVLFLYGALNQAYGLSFAQTESGFFRQADLVEIEGTGHEMIYFQWDQVYPAVLSYLNSLK